jgi:adenylosuccinate synthase
MTAFPRDAAVLADCAPVYTELSGWTKDIGAATRLQDLPHAAQEYIRQTATFTGVPVSHVSVGPDRSQIFSTAGD